VHVVVACAADAPNPPSASEVATIAVALVIIARFLIAVLLCAQGPPRVAQCVRVD
jgi:hypothetical protein